MRKITLGITGLLEILGRDYGIEKPFGGPSHLALLYFKNIIKETTVLHRR